MNRTISVTVLGRVGFDLYAVEQGVPLAEVRNFSRHLGGSSANMAVGLSRLGVPTTMLSALGDDSLSEYLLEEMRRENIDVSMVQRVPGRLPSLCLTEVCPPNGFAQVFYRKDPADEHVALSDLERQVICNSAFLITNGTALCAPPSRDSVCNALEWSRAAGVPTVFDVDYRAASWTSAETAAEWVHKVLGLLTTVVANEAELELVTGKSGEAGIRWLHDHGVSTVVAKLGGRGARLSTPAGSWFQPIFPVPVVSTVGCGDGFGAGFVAGLYQGLAPEASLRQGAAAAALVAQQIMCGEAMPTQEEIKELQSRHSDIVPVREDRGDAPGEGST